MAAVTVLAPSQSDILLVKLAREIAMDIQPLETILKQYSITAEMWGDLQHNSKFLGLVASEVEAWNSATNTADRVRLKAASMFEEFLPELNNRLHDADEALPAKIEGAKLVAKIAGLGERSNEGAAGGERFTVTINLGEDAKLVIEKTLPAKVIDHDAAELIRSTRDSWETPAA